MRIERTGPVKSLTPRVEKFLVESLRAVCLDDIQSHSLLRADYSCLGGLLAIEVKSLEEDGSERIDNLTDELRKRDDWPIFMGSAPIQSFLQHTSDPAGLNRRFIERVGRAIINHVKKANRQLEAHKRSFKRQNVASALLLINEDHTIYDPHTVARLVANALNRFENGIPLYEHVDFVVYFSERHATCIGEEIAFPVVVIEGAGANQSPWKTELANHVAKRWAYWNNVSDIEIDGSNHEFTSIDHIPDNAPRHEMWRIEYRRNPYLRLLSRQQLIERFQEIHVSTLLCFIKGSPIKMSDEGRNLNMECFCHMMEELAFRAIPITAIPVSLDIELAAAARLGLKREVSEWLIQLRS